MRALSIMSNTQSNSKFEVKELYGTLNKSQVKTKVSQPDMFGECRIGGKIYKISAWTKTSNNGNKYLSMAFQDVEEFKNQQINETEISADGDDLPF